MSKRPPQVTLEQVATWCNNLTTSLETAASLIAELRRDYKSLAVEVAKLREATAPYDPPDCNGAVRFERDGMLLVGFLSAALPGIRFKLILDSDGKASIKFCDTGEIAIFQSVAGLLDCVGTPGCLAIVRKPTQQSQ